MSGEHYEFHLSNMSAVELGTLSTHLSDNLPRFHPSLLGI